MMLLRRRDRWFGRNLLSLLPMGFVMFFLPGVALAAAPAAEVCPGAGLAARFVPCVADMIQGYANDFFDAVYPILETAIGLALLLAVIFFGVMLSVGMVKKVGRETLLMLIKLGSVILFTSNLALIYDWALSIMNGLIEIVSTYTIHGGALHCPSGDSVWVRIDCVINSIIGIGVGNGGALLQGGILSFLFGAVYSGGVGIMIAFIGGYMSFNIIISLFRAMIIYLISLMMLTVIVFSGLLFIPLVMFKASGSVYFKKWTHMLGSVILQPVIVFAFINVLLVTFDVIMFSGDNSVFRTIAGNAVDDPAFSLNSYMEDNKLYVKDKMTVFNVDLNPRTHGERPQPPNPYPGGFGPTGGNDPRTPIDPNITDPGSVRLGFEYRAIDWQKVVDARQGGPALPAGDARQGMMWATASAVLLAGLVSYLLIQLLGIMPRLAQDLGGGLKETAGISGDLPGEQMVSQGLGSATHQFEKLVTGR